MVAAAKNGGGGDLEKRVAAMVEELRANFESGACARARLVQSLSTAFMHGSIDQSIEAVCGHRSRGVWLGDGVMLYALVGFGCMREGVMIDD
jgi:hypothetical protein